MISIDLPSSLCMDVGLAKQKALNELMIDLVLCYGIN